MKGTKKEKKKGAREKLIIKYHKKGKGGEREERNEARGGRWKLIQTRVLVWRGKGGWTDGEGQRGKKTTK